jgi:hypothetical protein
MNEDAREQLPAKTTPTWEMELLVSGATIFGLLQLPHLIDRGYYTALNLSSAEYEGLLFPLWMYSKVAVITLVITFLVHLFLRGYWVALVGMNSVYPGGIRWENLRMGPIAMARSKAESGSMAAVIERADNRATRVFGTGFGFAMVMIIISVFIAVVLLLGTLVDAAFGAGHLGQVFGLSVTLLLVPWMAATLVDEGMGAKLPPESRVARLLDAVLGAYTRAGLGRRSNTLIAVFVSNEGRTRAVATALLLMLPVVCVLMLQTTIARGKLPLGLFVGLSTEDAFSESTSVSAFYADSGSDRAVFLPLPQIPSRVVDGAYVELFVPFIPRLHGPAMERACPGALPARELRSRLGCLAKLSDIRVDGAPVAVGLDASTDASTGQPGMLAMLPVGGLSPGRHELTLNSPGRDGGDPDRPQRRFRIPFWK